MKKQMQRKSSPEGILQNLRNMIDEAEGVLSRTSGRLKEEQLAELRERVQAGFNRLREYSGGVGDRVRDYYDEAEDRLRDYYDEVEDRVRSGVEKTGETVRSHPYKTLAIGLGIVLIAGALMTPSDKSR